MRKIAYALLAGLVGAVIIHIAVILTMPGVAGNNAWSRLSRLGDRYRFVRVDALRSRDAGPAAQSEGSTQQDFAFVDPAFVTASCRFSLAEGPVHLFAPEPTDFWSASIYNRQGDNLYSINDRSAVGGRFDLLVGTADELVEARANSADPKETSIPAEIAMDEGYVTLRVLVGEESERPGVDAFVRSARCDPAEPPEPSADPPAAAP